MKLLRAAALTLILAFSATAQTPRRWEPVSQPVEALQTQSDEVAVCVESGYIYVALARPMRVDLFTILGQMVVSGNLPAGAARLVSPPRGIYILKAGSTTKRITV